MAEYNARLHVKTSTGYDDINISTKASIVDFDKGDSSLESTDVNSAIKELDTNKLDKTNVANNLTTSSAGYALDARQGKVLNDNIDFYTKAEEVDISYDGWIDEYETHATKIGNFCIVSLCFGNKSSIDSFNELGIGQVNVNPKTFTNTVLFSQSKGTCIDCYVKPGNGKIYVNARGGNYPTDTFRGLLVFPIQYE